jgi:hypothetical protein
MRSAVLAFVLALAAPVSSASADPPAAPPAPTERRPRDPSWRGGSNRWFGAGLIDIGPLYLRPRLTVGWGRPFYSWVGVDTNPLVTGEGIGAYAGVRGSIPHVDLRAGARYFSTFSRALLVPQDEFSRLALEVKGGPSSHYLSAEAELTAVVPAGPGSIPLVLTGTYVTLVREGYWVYEDILRVVAKPPWIWGAATGYELPLGSSGRGNVGIVGELLGCPGRPSLVVRAGVTGSFRLGDLLELRAALVPAWISPDTLGAMGGQWFEIGLRFRFATGASAPFFFPPMI